MKNANKEDYIIRLGWYKDECTVLKKHVCNFDGILDYDYEEIADFENTEDAIKFINSL